jgi:hypothetical protein
MKRDFFLGVGLIVMSVIFWLELESVRNPAIMSEELSAAVFPRLMTGALAFLGLLLSVSSLMKWRRKHPGEIPKAGPGWNKFKSTYQVPFLMFFALTAYVFLIPVVGFYVMSLWFFISLGLLLGGLQVKNLIAVAATSLGTVLVIYYVFQVHMRVIMPSGFLF